MELANEKTNHFFPKHTQNRYLADHYTINISDENSQVSLLINQIEPGTTVIDVGCGQGKFGPYLKYEKHCRIFGLDIDPATVEYARKLNCYNDTFILDIESLDRPDYSEDMRRFSAIKDADYIILSNILEHLNDPTRVLRALNGYLKESGSFLISVPNIAHADIYLHLMNGEFNYSESGILDNTHVKYFTKSSFVQWISDMNTYFSDFNCECVYLGGTFYYNSYLTALKERHPSVYHAVEANPDFNVLEILFRLDKIGPNDRAAQIEQLLSKPPVNLVNYLDYLLSEKFPPDLYKMNFNERTHLNNQINGLTSEIERFRTQNREISVDFANRVAELNGYSTKLENELSELKVYNSKLESESKEQKAYILKLENESKEQKTYISKLENDMDEREKTEALLREHSMNLEERLQHAIAKHTHLKEYAEKVDAEFKELRAYAENVDTESNEMRTYIEKISEYIKQEEVYKYKHFVRIHRFLIRIEKRLMMSG